MENAMEYGDLYAAASSIAEKAYAPYSRFRVGAALLAADGTVVTGVNVENRSYGLTNCAERSAVYAAVSAGMRDFVAIAIATPDSDYPVSPCGACRQVLSEFMKADSPVIFGPNRGQLIRTTVGALYPFDALHELAKQ